MIEGELVLEKNRKGASGGDIRRGKTRAKVEPGISGVYNNSTGDNSQKPIESTGKEGKTRRKRF